MSEKIISVKSGKVIEKDEKKWIELVDQEDHTHRVFPSMLGDDGVWVHLDKEVDILKSYIEDGTIEGKAFKLIKEKKGTFWNVIGIQEVKDAFVKQAQKQVDDDQDNIKNRTITLSYAERLASAGVIAPITILEWADRFYQYVTTGIIGGKIEKKPSLGAFSADEEAKVSEEVPADEGEQGRDTTIYAIKEYAVALGWIKPDQKTQGKQLGDCIVQQFNKKGIPELTDSELAELEDSLHTMAVQEDIPF